MTALEWSPERVERKAISIFEHSQALIKGHFVFSSSKHGDAYLNKDLIYAHPALFTELARMLASLCSMSRPQIIVGASMGGALLANRVASVFYEAGFSNILSAYAEEIMIEKEKIRVFRREYDKLIESKRVLVVEDIGTSGDTTRKVVRAVRLIGGEVTGIGVVWNRGEVDLSDLKVPLVRYLVKKIVGMLYSESECPMCKEGMPINTSVGEGEEFVLKKKRGF